MERAEAIDAIEPADATEPMEPAEAIDAIEPAEASEPMEPAEAIDAIGVPEGKPSDSEARPAHAWKPFGVCMNPSSLAAPLRVTHSECSEFLTRRKPSCQNDL